MQAEMIKTYKSIHTWTGITSGLLLFIAFYAGALTMFIEPIARWVSPPSVGAAVVPLEDAPRLIEQVLAANPQAREAFQLELRSQEDVPARVTWEQHPVDVDGKPDSAREEHWWASLKPDGTLHTGRREPSELATIEGFIDMLHQTAGLPGSQRLGNTVMGIVSMVYAVALISGLIVLLPSLVKDLFLIRVGRNLKRMWLDAHNVIGVTSLPFHLIIALTASFYGLGGWLTAAQEPLNGRDQSDEVRRNALVPPDPSGQAAAMLTPRQILALAQPAAPSMTPRLLAYQNAGDSNARVMVVGQSDKYMTSYGGTGVTLSAVSGEVVGRYFVAEEIAGWMVGVRALDASHSGSFGGLSVRWAYFLLGLGGAWLFYSGNLLWIETRRKAQRKSGELPGQRKSTRWMAAATVGVCLGCVAGLSLTIAAGKWLHGYVADLNASHHHVYYGVFLGSVAWAFLRGAARAGAELLALSAAFTLAIPITTLLAWLLPSLGLWAHLSVAALSVDLTALVGGLCLAWMARVAARRAKYGAPDSVWSAWVGR